MADPLDVKPSRLFEVADMVLDLIESSENNMRSLNDLCWDLEDRVKNKQAAPTHVELDQAVALLIRMGFLAKVGGKH